MGNLDYKNFARRRRPHIQPRNANLFITFRLVGSIPKSVVRLYKQKKIWLERQVEQLIGLGEDQSSQVVQEQLRRLQKFSEEWFLKFEDTLHKAKTGPLWISKRRGG